MLNDETVQNVGVVRSLAEMAGGPSTRRWHTTTTAPESVLVTSSATATNLRRPSNRGVQQRVRYWTPKKAMISMGRKSS